MMIFHRPRDHTDCANYIITTGSDVKERESIETLYEMFDDIKAWLYPAPGLKVSESKKRKWDGTLEEIDEDFVRFVDLHCRRTFREVRTQRVFGTDLSPDTFVDIVETLVGAFQGMEVSQMSMVEAIGKVEIDRNFWRLTLSCSVALPKPIIEFLMHDSDIS